jgi:4-amino-4-deoxy-L-arabinose transferase-like glycosyltransferase
MKFEIASKSIIERFEWQIFGGLLLIAFSLHIFSTYGGLIWSSDSFHYWAASRSFRSDRLFEAFDGGAYTFWPPLYPIILSFFSEKSYHVFHALCFLSSFLFIYLLFKKNTHKKLALLSLAIFTISVYPYLISSFLWSETIFILLLYSGLYFYEQWHSDKNKNTLLLISAVLLSLMCLQRNAGIFVIAGLSLFYLITFLKEKKWGIFIRMACIHILIVTPNILWNIYQKIYFTEDYNISNGHYIIEFFANFETFSLELIRFFIPYSENSSFILTLILGIIIFTTILFQNRKSLYFYVLSTYVLLFLLLPKFEFSETGRFLAPLLPIIILQLVLLCQRIFTQSRSRKIKILISVILALFIFYNTARTIKNTMQWNYRSIHHPKSAKIFF